MIHTDTLNESGFVENTLRAIDGRTIHAFHTEGAAVDTRPILLKFVVREYYSLINKSNSSLYCEYARGTSRYADGMPSSGQVIPEDVAFAESQSDENHCSRRYTS